MKIQQVAIVGLGALGVLYAEHFSKRLPKERVEVIADATRIERYKRDGIFCNGEPCTFHYVTPEQATPADLILIATKFDGLSEAIEIIRPIVQKQTIILSVLNGIISEEEIAKAFGVEHTLYCVAQGMDALKTGNHMTYVNKGLLCIGADLEGMELERLHTVTKFFDETEFPYEVDPQMRHRLWGKFMLNVGVNQTVAAIEGTFHDVQIEGEAREMMISAMREVIKIGQAEGIALSEKDLAYWLDILATLNPEGKPSMAQDVDAKRKSELPLFAGTIRKLGVKHQIATPTNDKLYAIIQAKESNY